MMDESPTQIVTLVILIFYATAQVQCSNGNSFIYVNVDVYTWHSHFVWQSECFGYLSYKLYIKLT